MHGRHVVCPVAALSVPAGHALHAAVVAPPVEKEPAGQRPPVFDAQPAQPVVETVTVVHAAVVAPPVAYAPAAHGPVVTLFPPEQ